MIASHRESAQAWKTTRHRRPGLGELRSSKPGALRRRWPDSGCWHCSSRGSGTTVTTGSAPCATSSLSACASTSRTAAKLDQLIAGVDSLPLAQEARPQASAAAKREADGLWERLAAELLGELKQLVRIENMEGSAPALLSPPQEFFLRENLKLRLLNARLALLARDETAYHGDVKLEASWLGRYFDTRSRAAVALAATLKQLGSDSAGVSLPTIGESLAAVRAYRS